MAYWTHTKNPIGVFTEREVGNYFEYSLNDDPHTSFNGDFPHKIWVGDGYRYGNVKKTVAVICVDEDAYGYPVTQKWQIKQHREYAI